MCPTERVTITQHDTVRVFMAIYDKLAEPPLQTSSGINTSHSHVVLHLRTMQDYTGFVTSSFMAWEIFDVPYPRPGSIGIAAIDFCYITIHVTMTIDYQQKSYTVIAVWLCDGLPTCLIISNWSDIAPP